MKNFIIILISSFLALVCFELFLKYSPFELGISATKYDKKIGLWHKENFQEYIVEECYKNKYSYDEKGRPSNIVPYDSNKKDVILLGDSNVEARMVKNEYIMHNSLAKEFNYKYNFMNYGLAGTGPTQQLVILQEKVDLSNTKYLLQFIDIEGDLLDVDSKNLSSLARPKVYVEFDNLDDYTIIPPRKETLFDKISDRLNYYQSYLFVKRTLYFLQNKLTSKKEDTPQTKEEVDLSKNWLYLKGAIYQTAKLVKSIDSKIQYKLILRSKSEKNKAIMKKFLHEQNIDFFFLNETAKELNLKLDSFTCDSHWTSKAHQNIAKIIKEIEFIQ